MARPGTSIGSESTEGRAGAPFSFWVRLALNSYRLKLVHERHVITCVNCKKYIQTRHLHPASFLWPHFEVEIAMKTTILAATLVCAATSGFAGTFSLDWIGGPQTVEDYCCVYPGEVYTTGARSGRFFFDVANLSEPIFDFSMEGTVRKFPEEGTFNPYGATLVSRPDGHLGGYDEVNYTISVRPGAVNVSGYFSDFDDFLSLSSTSYIEDHNQGMRIESSTGYWMASYIPDDLSDGSPFMVVPAPVPLPATAPLLLVALGAAGVAARRRGAA